MKVYVASSWRNEHYVHVLRALRNDGHEVYDFKNPASAFDWRDIDEAWRCWSPRRMVAALDHPLAHAGFSSDMAALREAEAVVLVQPCGISSHLELGYAVGAGKHTAVLVQSGEPELMYKMVGKLATSIAEVREWLKEMEAFR